MDFLYNSSLFGWLVMFSTSWAPSCKAFFQPWYGLRKKWMLCWFVSVDSVSVLLFSRYGASRPVFLLQRLHLEGRGPPSTKAKYSRSTWLTHKVENSVREVEDEFQLDLLGQIFGYLCAVLYLGSYSTFPNLQVHEPNTPNRVPHSSNLAELSTKIHRWDQHAVLFVCLYWQSDICVVNICIWTSM